MTDSATATLEPVTPDTEYWGEESGIASPPSAPRMKYNERSIRSKYSEFSSWAEKLDPFAQSIEASIKETMETLVSDRYKFKRNDATFVSDEFYVPIRKTPLFADKPEIEIDIDFSKAEIWRSKININDFLDCLEDDV